MASSMFVGGPLGGSQEGYADLGIPDPNASTPPEKSPLYDEQKREECRQWAIECLREAKAARETGPNPRKDEWRRNWNAYWGRQETSGKQAWQADERLPTVSDYVERFVAAIRDALGAAPDWYTFIDPLRKSGQLEALAKQIMDASLAHCSSNVTGQHVGFIPVFTSAVKAGCMSRIAVSVTWRDGRLRIDNVDARELYHDPTGAGLYRVRERAIDLHRIQALKALVRADGSNIYDHAAIDRLVGGLGADAEYVVERERMSGHGQQTDTSRRRPVMVQEFLGDILGRDGSLIAKNQLLVVANETEVIRGPEPNPFWHGMDWIVCAPIIDVPFSVDGRSYVESFAQLASLFMEFTNLLLDGVRLEAVPAYMLWPELLADSGQATDGVTPGKMFLADQDAPLDAPFLRKIDMGQVPQQMFATWEAISQLMRDAASQNELRLGKLASKSNVTATEIDTAEGNSNVLVKHLAHGIEQNVLSPTLELGWYTILQHLDESSDREVLAEMGPDLVQMIVAQRDDLRRQGFRLRATGISGVMSLAQERRALTALLDTLGRSDLLAQQFLADFSLGRVLDQLMRSMRLDSRQLRKTQEEAAAAAGAAPGLPMPAGGRQPQDANPQLPVNLARARALRLPRGVPPSQATEALPRGDGGRSGRGPV